MKSAFAIACIATSASAFWGEGHVIVAARAQQILEASGTNALENALADLTYLKKYYPSLTSEEENHPFTECATFADNIKSKGYSGQSDWHFIDEPYMDQGGTLDDYDFEYPASVDVIHAMDTCVKICKGQTDQIAADDQYYQQIQSWFSYEDDQRSFALRLIIHYVGDMHQPLHDTSEVDENFPEGDRGGNDQWIPNIDGAGNLHAAWDSVLYKYMPYVDQPLSDDDWNYFNEQATDLATLYPVTQDLLEGQFQAWADQGEEISEEYVYGEGFEFDPNDPYNQHPLTQDYLDRCIPILESNMMLGAARLAALIEDIYGTSSKETIAFDDSVGKTFTQ